jgi:hypothetical protein
MDHILMNPQAQSWIWILIAVFALFGIFCFVAAISVRVYRLVGKLLGWDSQEIDVEISDTDWQRHIRKQVDIMGISRASDVEGFR